jgi:CRISPR-associated protein Cas1
LIKRVVDVSSRSFLQLKQGQLIVNQNGEVIAKIPVEDLGVLILQHSAITITQSLIVCCQKHNVVIVFCDEKHLPYSVIFPLVEGNSLHSKIIRKQIKIPLPRSKRIWQSVVSAKIKNQAKTLLKEGVKDSQLDRMSKMVKSGDPSNIEAQAARRYWTLLFGKNFRRNRGEEGINSLLNYGYSIVRAMTARAIVAGGLHPALGIHHKNQYNGLNLADDLMEPFRPWVDSLVLGLSKNEINSVNIHSKKVLLSLPATPVFLAGKKMPLMVSMHSMITQFRKALTDKAIKLEYPVLI